MKLGKEIRSNLDYSNVDPLKPISVVNFLKEIDKPFFEKEYKKCFQYLKHTDRTLISVLKLYLSKMDLMSYRNFTFKDGDTIIPENKYYEITVNDYYIIDKVEEGEI